MSTRTGPVVSESGNAPIDVNQLSMRVRELAVTDIDDEFRQRWDDLESRSLEGNVFLSPNFIVPSMKYLTPDAKPVILVVEQDSTTELMGLGVFEVDNGNSHLPLTHLKAYRSIHSFLDGLLIDKSHGHAALTALFKFLLDHGNRWHGLRFRWRVDDSEQARLVQQVTDELDIPWFTDASHVRAMLIPSKIGDDYLSALYSRNRRKAFKRGRKQLEECGEVNVRHLRCGDEFARCAETFMELEGMGWKGDEGTALICNPNEADFYREMIAGFATTGRALFVEMTCGGNVVSLQSALISGRVGFTFKIAHHTDYSDFGAGTLNNLEMVAACPTEYTDIDWFDSCAAVGSQMETMWPTDRRTIVSGLFATSLRGKMCASTLYGLRRVKRRIAQMRGV